MKIRKSQIVLLLGLLVLCASGIFAQNASRAQKAYDSWLASRANSGVRIDDREVYIAMSAIKYENVGATIDLVVGVGEGVRKWGDIEFTVQPVAIKKGKDGKLIFEDLAGGGAKLKTNMIDENGEVERSQNGVIASPQLTIKMPEGAGAVKITVKEANSEKSFDVMLPLLDSGASAVLSGVLDGSDVYAKCQWWQLTCSGSCGTLCIGCNGSPNGNCANCTITCQSGEPCTPTGPRPPACS